MNVNNGGVVVIQFVRILSLISFIFILVGCMQSETSYDRAEDNSLELTKLSTKGLTDQQPADQAKHFLSQFEEVSSVRAVNNDGQLLIAVELNHHDRFATDRLEKELTKEVKKQYNDMQITLSTDQKVLLELRKLEEAITNNNISKEDIKKELHRIKKLSKEQT